jgi:hypothetical protein
LLHSENIVAANQRNSGIHLGNRSSHVTPVQNRLR